MEHFRDLGREERGRVETIDYKRTQRSSRGQCLRMSSQICLWKRSRLAMIRWRPIPTCMSGSARGGLRARFHRAWLVKREIV
jgi:hypothetical protein